MEQKALNLMEKAKRFIYRTARPLDLARWKFHFENGAVEHVLQALAAFQNEDGGFGNAVELDYWNPASSPIQTWKATKFLRECGVTDPQNEAIQGILKYLSSDKDFDTERCMWLQELPSNNEHPHAIWWTYKAEKIQCQYNPTASLAGFYLKYGNRQDPFYATALQIAQETCRHWLADRKDDMHVTSCLIDLYEYCTEANVNIGDMDALRQELIASVNYELEIEADQWDTGYVCMPSHFILSPQSMFYPTNAELVHKEIARIMQSQLPDGSFEVPWKWWTEYPEFEVAKTWWKADFCIKYVRLIQAFSET